MLGKYYFEDEGLTSNLGCLLTYLAGFAHRQDLGPPTPTTPRDDT